MRSVLIIFVFLIETGCSTTAPRHSTLTQAPDELTVDQLLREQADVWLGTPHLLGGTGTTGIDCSALVQTIYRDVFSVDLPRTTTQQARSGIHVPNAQLQAGDLVFYRIDARTRHVGIYLSENEFLHASKSEGVTISPINLPYWQKRIWTVRRLLDSTPNPVSTEAQHPPKDNSRVSW